jgi:protein-tyrosine kinase
MSMDTDPISRALERAQKDGSSVRTWVTSPPREQVAAPASPAGPEDIRARPIDLDPAHLAAHLILSGPGHEDPVIADKYRLLRTQLLKRMQAHGWTKLGVTSAGPKAGKTLTSINLALSLARSGNERVVLIDADLRKSSMAEDLGIDTPAGIIDYLSGDLDLDEVAVSCNDAQLIVIPGRRVDLTIPTPEVLRSPRMADLIARATASSTPTIVVVDLPPVVVGDDVIAVAGYLDALILVIEEGGTEVQDVKEAVELLADFNLLGSVLNKSLERDRDVEGYYQAASTRRSVARNQQRV